METRRRFLGWLLFSAIGVGIVLASDSITAVASISRSGTRSATTSPPTLLTGETSGASVSFLCVKVVYSQMSEYIATDSEYFVLRSPATVSDLVNNVADRHPSVKMMMANMWILVNGTPAQLSEALKDGEEVDFIPLVAGG